MMNIEIKLGSLEKKYRLVNTGAPKAYDGFGTIELCESYLNDRESRLVLVDEQHFDWQTGRYGSGMHGVDTEGVDWVSEQDVIELLWKRIQGTVQTS